MPCTAKRLIPIVFVVVSILYIVFGFSLEQRRMIGDERGWDPGLRTMPLGIGFLMLSLSLYLALKREQSEEHEMPRPDPGSLKLISLTIILSILYILVFRYVGFILATNILLFTLIYFNDKQDITWNILPNWVLGSLGSTGFIVLLYSIGRFTTRYLFVTGKRSNINIFTNRLVMTGVTFIAVTGIFLIMVFLLKKFFKSDPSRIVINAAFVATGTTEFLYLVFRQIFWVSLAKGLIFW